MLTFQEIIQKLTEYWAKKQCIIHQGHGVEVGAGTFNPATFLRCLGPEPYNTAYIEPSRRPSDGRYGENPNRIQLFHQFQVILKPSPPNAQKLYLDSLRSLGFDLKKHDIRFVHDDWESPTIGAWGLGWEVWCDGMEVTQFTYFQAIGSLPLKPISAELTYGLERLAMFIQNKESIYDVQWNDTLTFGDIIHRNEVEWSTYHFEEASIEMWKHHFEDFEKEAKTLIAHHLPLPAYDFVIKASHAFNLLDARGAISVTERTGYIGRIRDLARLIAAEYTAMREKIGFPLLAKTKEKKVKKEVVLKKAPSFDPKKRKDFLLEIGSEQLPATFIPIGCRQLEKGMKALFETHNLSFEDLKVFGTPQRLAILVTGLCEGSEDQLLERRGPPVSTCFDSSGVITPQGEGFLKSLHLSSTSLKDLRNGKKKHLRIDSIKGIEYLFATVLKKGESTFMLLAKELPSLILNLEFPKKMRWADLDISYPRPLHWFVSLFGESVIPFKVGDIESSRFSFGHAQLKDEKIVIKQPKSYLKAMRDSFVLADIEERKESILKQIAKLEKKFKLKVIEIDRVLKEVLHLTEWPQLTAATFDEKFLKAPKEVLISEMVEHQKYFPTQDLNNQLKNIFIITADNTPSPLICKGNQKVLSARLNDGVFLYEQDVKIPLETFNDKLENMAYLKGLGSMLNKVKRLSKIAELLNTSLQIADQKTVAVASLICKADLASSLVKEFPELQGTVGKYYALDQGYDPQVAQAIEEHWMPRSEHSLLPKTATGIILSLADKVDNLLSCYSVDLKPSSSNDPYALRRQSIGLLKILIKQKSTIHLQDLFLKASQLFPTIKTPQPIVEEILQFITARTKSVLEEEGFKKEEVDACLQGLCIDPYDLFCKTKALHLFRQSGSDFAKLLEVYRRAKGQLSTPTQTLFDPKLATEPSEKALVKALETLHHELDGLLKDKKYLEAFHALAKLQDPLAQLFNSVKILTDDLKLRENRVALLQKVFTPFKELLDFNKIQ